MNRQNAVRMGNGILFSLKKAGSLATGHKDITDRIFLLHRQDFKAAILQPCSRVLRKTRCINGISAEK